MLQIDLQLITTACALIASACAIWVARRSGDWRETDEAKKLVSRIDVLELKASSAPSKSEIATINARIEALATKEELAGVRSDVRSLVREVGKVDAGVTRIEQLLMETER